MIVVTGGAGFIGSNLVAALEALDVDDVVVCDNFGSDDKWRNLAKRELAALVPPEELFEFLEDNRSDIDAVYHLGAISSTTETDVDRILRTNFALSLDLWNWCALQGKRLFYASSAATYGDGSQGFDDDGTIDGLADLRPLNPYGWSKHLFDRRVARLVAEEYPEPPQWAGFKFFNVYGPNEYHKGDQRSVVEQIYRQAEAGQPARLFRSHRQDIADGGQKRDFVWVGDCTGVLTWFFENPEVSGLFNLGTGEARSFDELARAVFAARGETPNIEFVDTPESLRDRYQYFTQAEMDRLREAGYEVPFTSLEEGVAAYVRDFLSQPDPYR